MKINVDMDVTPEEMRRLFGLPDLTPLHDEMIDRMKEQLSENMDPAKLVENYMQGSFSSMEAFQRTMSNFIKSGNKDD
ncbi:DUF6489 family protein [Solemya velum gill symbiont]|uniref:Uncharacterized protein n=1 Tax=Solemya velum gill symbiont TaxID=2340 RepID=A0A0B0HGB4_SOVGS|nr:DUF6489 family protein [Solemya velum gill symbiont]KHF26506.1 hypothetical protein JV46_11720 [Solemya velum gill symbiont]OOY52686.1 hypothetical protein BOV97_05015 [Solemya velum gill symbiont]OOY65793.1 hypothetical protein BOW05_03785 [Solemya velum gill symbiont]OOY67811.1 hypothetical protein BOW06_04995 [Solemya velum gill symbiont]OOY70286.1 hypothetical protein BOW07_04820 [Solemya velum gill symbiont]